MEIDDLLPIDEPGRSEFLKMLAWTLDDATKAEKKWEKSETHPPYACGPVIQWSAVKISEHLYNIFSEKKGDPVRGRLLILATTMCAGAGLPAPKWCKDAFAKIYRQIISYGLDKNSWDEILGTPYPKGTHIKSKRRKQKMQNKVYTMVKTIKKAKPSVPIDEFLFKAIGEALGISASTARDDYYEKMDFFDEFPFFHKIKKTDT